MVKLREWFLPSRRRYTLSSYANWKWGRVSKVGRYIVYIVETWTCKRRSLSVHRRVHYLLGVIDKDKRMEDVMGLPDSAGIKYSWVLRDEPLTKEPQTWYYNSWDHLKKRVNPVVVVNYYFLKILHVYLRYVLFVERFRSFLIATSSDNALSE